MKKKIFCLILSAAAVCAVHAQSDYRNWLVYFHNQQLSKKFIFRGDVQLRSSAEVKHVNNLLLRAAVDYRFNAKHELGLGYLFAPEWRQSGADRYIPEHRIFQQYIFNKKFKRSEFLFRQRLEQRFVIREPETVFIGRARSWGSFRFPIATNADFSKGMYGVVLEEIFLNVMNKKYTAGFFDQNRLQGGVGYRWSKKFDTDLTYMLRTTNTTGGTLQSNILILTGTAKL